MLTFAQRSGAVGRLARRVSAAMAALCLGVFSATTASAALEVSMSIAPTYANPIFPGDITAFRITLTNSNPTSTVTNLAFTNNLPSGLRVAGMGLRAYTCTDGDGVVTSGVGTASAVGGGGVISLASGVIPAAKPAGASGRCELDVEVTSTVRNSVQTNTIPAAAVTGMDTVAVSNGTPAVQSVTVNNLNLPVITKSFSSATVVKSDQTVTLTIVISNANNPTVNLPLNGAPAFAIQDSLPTGLEVAAAPNATAVCSGAGIAPVFSPSAGTTTLTAVGGTVAGGGTCTLTVRLIGTTTNGAFSNALVNTIDRAADFGNVRGLVPAANATASLSIQSALRVTKAFSPGTVAAGQSATLTITLSNASPTQAITLDAGNPFVDSPIDGVGNAGFGLKVGVPSTTCGGTVVATGGNLGIMLTGGAIPAASSCTITAPFTGTLQTPGTPQSFTNTIPEGAVKATDASIISQLAVASVNVVDQLTVAKSVSPTNAVAAGNPVRYTITVNNFSGGALTNVTIRDVLPAGMLLLPTTPAPPTLAGASCSGLTQSGASTAAVPEFVIASFAGNSGASPATCTVTFWAQTPQNAAPGAVLSNQIAAGGVTGTGGGGGVSNANGSGAVNTTVGNVVTVNKSFAPASAFEGVVSQLTIVYTNLSAQPITAASFTDNLPLGNSGAQLVIANPALASTTCANGVVTATPGAAVVSLGGATIPARASNGTGANGTCTLTVSVVGAAGSYVNTLPAAALSGTETYADNTTHVATSPGPVSASLVYSSALTALKSFSPTTISSGGMSTVTITLGNVGDGTLNNVGVLDPLPSGLVIASPAVGQTTCGGAPVITATPGASSAALAGAVIPASGQCTFQFNVTGTGSGNWINTIPAGNVSAAGGVRNVSPVTATLTNSSAGAITVTNNTSPNSLTSPGQVSVLTVTLTNGGTIGLTGLSLTDFFTVNGLAGGAATGMVVAPTPNASTTCPGGVASATAGGASLGLSGASLAAAASCTVSVNVTLQTTGTVQNLIPVGAVTSAQGISNTLSTTTSLSAGANIGVTKVFTPAVIKPGGRSRLRITFINPLALALTNLSSTDNLPSGVVVPAGANPSTTCVGATVSAPSASQVTVTGASLPAAANGVSAICIAEIDVQAAAAGTYLNTIAAGGVTATAGGGTANNPVPATATLEVRSPVAIAKAFSPNSVGLGVPSTLTITLTNPNTINLTSGALVDNLPANVTVALTPNASTTCVNGVVTAPVSATSVVLTGATLPASGACTVTVSVVSNVAGVYLNTIPAGGLATAQGVTNENPASDTLRIINPPTISKQFAPTAIPANGVSTLTIVLGNTNATAATLTADLIDTLPISPAAIVVAPSPAIGGTCTTASVTALAGSGTVRYASGASIPAGGCTITVNVTGATEGVFTNIIPVGGLQTSQGSNVQATTADLTISPLGFISGTVFRDNNLTPNGTLELGVDSPISGVTLNLTGTDFGANGVAGGGDDVAVSRTVTTDSLGNYAFTGLNAGSYTVTEPTQPAGTNNGITTAGAVTGGGGGTPGTATAISVTPSSIGAITLLRDGMMRVASSPSNNFAEVQPSSIAGSVFLDQDDNGVRNASDTALVGVTLQLLNGANAVVSTTVTDSAGAYAFTGLAPGTYTVREPSQPGGTANGKTLAGTVPNGGTAGTATGQMVLPSQIASIVLPPATASVANDFAEVPAGRQISGRVFVDSNNDGVFNGADSALSGVTLALSGTDFNNQPVSATTSTAADGRYVFTGLAAGTYTVTEPSQPPSTNNGITTAGSTGGLATLVAVTPSAISSINLTGVNSISSGNDFAEVAAPAPPPPPPGSSTVSGRVYIDLNDNGQIDAGEQGLAGVTVTLTGTSSTGAMVNLTTFTGSDGAYQFTGVPQSGAGGYSITEIQPSAFGDGRTTVIGSPGTPSTTKPVASGGSDVITGVVVPASSNLTGYNFGERPQGSVSGLVYVDANNNGARDAAEAPIAGVTLRLTGLDASGATIDRTVVTGADGVYLFANLPASGPTGYTVTEIQPAAFGDGQTTLATGLPGAASATKPVAAGGLDTVTGVTLGTGVQLVGYNFGERSGGVISGQVYVDTNNNGVRDAGEAPIAGVTVRLTGTDIAGQSVDRTVVTDADGGYVFSGLAASNASGYTISEVQPAAFGDGRTTVAAGNPGTATATKPVAAGGSDAITGVVLVAGTSLTRYDFGERKIASSVAGFVYVDTNNNGVRDAGEGGIGDVIVRLTGTDTNGLAVNLVRTTDATGAFLFADVPPSNATGYTLTEVQPTGFNDGRTGIAPGSPGQTNSAKPVGVGNDDRITQIVLPPNTNLVDYRFGEIAIPQLKPPIINGYVFLDRNHTRIRPTDGALSGQAGWTVVLRQNGAPICTTTTDATGFYQFDNLRCPGYEVSGLPLGPGFSITFSKDGNTLPAVPTSGGNRGTVPPTGSQIINITLGPADRVVEQNLPLDPAGVVYDALTRRPVPGATVVITGPAGFTPSTHLIGGGAAQTQVVGADGQYQFLLQNNFPSGVYTLTVTAPAGYLPAPSTLLPPCAATLNVTRIPDPALVQASDFAPGPNVTPQLNPATCPGLVAGGSSTTQYYFNFAITNGGSAPVLNNHIPLDPILGGTLMVTKATPMVWVSRGDLVPYTITATNPTAAPLTFVSIRDQLPPGFKYREGSATRNGQPVTPSVSGGFVTWPAEAFAAKEKKTYQLMLVVGAGVGDGDYINRAWAGIGAGGQQASNTASASVRIAPDPTFDCPDVIGKVFDDRNANGYQDEGEPGIPAVRMATPNGLLITSDAEGRFHVPCPAVPNPDRGSNFVMKLDERSLPSGFRVTTENPRDVRLTRGKLVKLNFGATIHRVVRVELSGAAFETGGATLLPAWNAQIDALPASLKARPSIVRISYAAKGDPPDLVRKRTEAVRKQIAKAWKQSKGQYTLVVEIEGQS